MKPAVEFLGFASVAALAHLAVFAAVAPDGRAAGGDGGAGAVTVAAPLGAADADIAALVRQWETPPRLQEPATSPSPSPAPEAAAMTPASTSAALPRLPRTMPLEPPAADAPMARDTAPPPALFDTPETRTTPRPRARPDPDPDPRRTAQEPPPQQAAPQAARSGGQGQAAQQGQGQAPVASGSAATASLLSEWGGAIRAAVQRQQSSPGTRARGTVHLHLQVSTDGRLVHVAISQSSGHAALDRAALQAVQRARLPRAPSGLSGRYQFNLPLGYR